MHTQENDYWEFHLAVKKQDNKQMKTKHLCSFLVILLLNSCYSEEHLTFNDIPIDGPLNKYAGELVKSGFTISDSTKNHEIILDGVFLNKDCTIGVFATVKSDLVYKVIVHLPKQEHDSLQSDFIKLQKLFSLKYGMGTSRYQQYQKRERLVYKVPARDIRVGDSTKYSTDSGEIMMEVRVGYISVAYVDKLNNEIWKSEMEAGQK